MVLYLIFVYLKIRKAYLKRLKTIRIDSDLKFFRGDKMNALVYNYVGVAVAVILGLGVTYTIVKDVIAQANLTGIDATVGSFIGTFVIVGLLLTVLSIF